MELPNNCKGCHDVADDLLFGYCADCYWNLASCTREAQARAGMADVFTAVLSGNVGFLQDLILADQLRAQQGVKIRPIAQEWE